MGLMLSILVVCVGVIEALSCYEHFQYGVIHCATNVYESARRSSLFLSNASKRLGFLANDIEPEVNDEGGKSFQPFRSLDESVRILEEPDLSVETPYSFETADDFTSRSKKKLKHEDKIDIVKKHFERPPVKRPKPVRSVSMPALIHTEEDIKLSKIINDLAIEPIEEVDIEIEIEISNPEVLMKEFEKLFDDYEPSYYKNPLENAVQNLKYRVEPMDEQIGLNLTEEEEKPIRLLNNFNDLANENCHEEDIGTFNELQKKFSLEKTCSKNLLDKTTAAETRSKEDLVREYLSKKPADRQLKRSISALESKMCPPVEKNISSAAPKQITDPSILTSTSLISCNKSFDFDDPSPVNKLADVILENETLSNVSVEMIDKTFEEIYSDLNDECLDVMNVYEEIERDVANEWERKGDEMGENPVNDVEPQDDKVLSENSSEKIFGENISRTVFMKAIDQLADLLVEDCLNQFKNTCSKQLCDMDSSSNEKTAMLELTNDAEFSRSIPNLDEMKNSRIVNNSEMEFSVENKEMQPKLIENKNDAVKPTVVNNIPVVLKNSSILPFDMSESENKNDTRVLENSETQTCSTNSNSKVIHPHEKSIIDDKPFGGEETPVLAIKGVVLPALEYKTKNTANSEEIKMEIIPMEWKSDSSEESAAVKTLPEVSMDLFKTTLKKLETSQSENDSLNNDLERCLDKGEENEAVGEVEFSRELIPIEPDLNKEKSDTPIDRKESPEPGISSLVENIESKVTALPVTETIAILEKVSDKMSTPLSDGCNLLAIKDGVVQHLECKNDKKYTSEDGDKEIIPMKWKTDIHKTNINCDECIDKDLTVMDLKPSQVHGEVECDENSEYSGKGISNTKNLVEFSPGVDLNATPLNLDQVIVEVNSEEVSNRKEASDGAVTQSIHPDSTEFQNLSVTQKSKPNSESSQFLSPDCSSPEGTTNAIDDGGTGNEKIPQSERENEYELTNGSKNLSARNNDNAVKDTNSTPQAFWLIFSGEYTKAMSKDWHSGHFSCWQCDEALTGQRYVLRDDHPYCIKCYESVFANVCEECNKIIGIDSKDLSYKDKHWHEACFLCNKCRVSLVDKQFGSKADKIYCGNCYDAQFASRCDGCGEIFRAGTKKMEYKTRQWHEKCFCCCVCKTPIGTKSFIPREQEIYCATCYEEKFATRCVKCNKIITSGGVTYKNEPWHRECFTCTSCNTSLAGQRFTSRDEKPYCADCFGELFAKRCTACNRPITGIGGTRFISFEDRHWHNDCFICASCKTSLVGRGFITDGDDIICPECAKQKLM